LKRRRFFVARRHGEIEAKHRLAFLTLGTIATFRGKIMGANNVNKSPRTESRVTNGMALKAFNERITWLINRHGYRYVAKYTRRSSAWLGHAVSCRWKKIKPTPIDTARVEAIYLLEMHRNKATGTESEALFQAIELIAAAEKRLDIAVRSISRRRRNPRSRRNGSRH
jgi:hypothetical protein